MMEPRYFSIKQYHRVLWQASYVMVKYAKELKGMDKKFRSNVMMAVTNVNGCTACSHYHTSELIKAGATEEEMNYILESLYDDVESEDQVALLFAEHYADTFGHYDQETFEKVKSQYGLKKTGTILAAIKAIMLGNVLGITFGHMGARFRFKKAKNANLFTDLYIIFFTIILMPVFIIFNLFRKKKLA